ncbi:hypothetical protein [Brevibacillus porteri]|uniref:hypothetical protein n=1 Tax=Brevibacillus porteri TaxID=2126350 RepID=UPI00370CEEEA
MKNQQLLLALFGFVLTFLGLIIKEAFLKIPILGILIPVIVYFLMGRAALDYSKRITTVTLIKEIIDVCIAEDSKNEKKANL